MRYYGFKSVAKFPRSNLKNLGFANGMAQVIKSLFANQEQGFAFDFNDLSTMYQDAAGTIPVTGVGQPVGLVLDKSKGLRTGENLIPQKSFAEGTTGWVLQSGWVKAEGKVSNKTGGTALESPLQLVVGKLYIITLNTRRTSEGGSLSIRSGVTIDTQMVNPSVDGIQSFLLRPTVSTNTLRFQSAGWYGDIHSVEVVEIYGNHAYQSTSSKRPILKSSPTQLNYDGIDDVLTVNLPAQLTGCTVIRAIPNVGTQILTNQTISAPYSDSTTNSGLIVVNRALTSEETTRVTQVFNKLAGV